MYTGYIRMHNTENFNLKDAPEEAEEAEVIEATAFRI